MFIVRTLIYFYHESRKLDQAVHKMDIPVILTSVKPIHLHIRVLSDQYLTLSSSSRAGFLAESGQPVNNYESIRTRWTDLKWGLEMISVERYNQM